MSCRTNAKALHYRRAAKCVSDDYVGELLRPEPDASGAGGVGFLSPADLFSPVPSKSAEILHSEEAEAAQELLQMKLLRMFGADEAPKWKAAQGLVKCGGENGRWSDWSALAEWRSKRRGVRRHAGGSLGSIGRDWYGRGGKTQALVSNEASGGGDRAVHCGSSLSAERERVRFVLPSAVDVGGNSKDNVVAMCRMEEDPDAFEQKLDVENEML